MPFQMFDVTAGIPILYIDNAGNMGLGSLPSNSQAITVGNAGIVSPLAIFTGLIAVPGVPLAQTGSILIAPASSGGITVVYIEVPSLTSSTYPTEVSPTSITWTNTGTTSTLTVVYGTW
jgi:hypothetical protein